MATQDDLFEMHSTAHPDLVRYVQKEAHDRLLAGQMEGLLTSRAALHGIDYAHLAEFAALLGEQMAQQIEDEPERFSQKLHKAADRVRIMR
ncbi:hypothetical protein [Novosphingobium album (ex Hu et al. 2023)]|uniref:Uncharacterized protein n=1 Tax=Novosphingobium album (ex Hu et al. 2023) TaxID=2930093 RepID=A0ABT0B7L1_9SPHN|nr:hypothetical protein [Novosphingobium album (ex Hu et al. 2023)]MCJ2181056.1 hypothetical protein [Novosphingobium album (ex Hu et al. 2023)]